MITRWHRSRGRAIQVWETAVATLVAVVLSASPIPAQTKTESAATGEWPQFLGPTRNGISPETGLLDRWPEGGPAVLWKVSGGVGMSAVVVSRERAVTMVQRDGQQWLVALAMDTGKPIWQSPLAPAYTNQMGDGPRATPAIAADLVFAFAGDGTLAAVNFSDGKTIWSHKTLGELSAKEADYGMACSPLVVGDLVIVTVGSPQATLAAYDTKSGKLRWKAGSKDPAGYSSPALLQLAGRTQVVAFTGSSAIGVVPESGDLLWRFPYETNYECNIATPLDVQGKVLLSSGENHGSVLLELKPKGEQFDLHPVWESFGPMSVLRSEWQTSLLVDGFLYGMDNVGGAGPITHLTCVKAATGERLWQQVRFGKGNLIAADGKMFITTMKGELVVARLSPQKYDEIGRATFLGSTRQAPSLSKGRLLLRDDQDIVCLDVRKK